MLFLLPSALINAAVLCLAVLLASHRPPIVKRRSVTMRTISASQWAANRGAKFASSNATAQVPLKQRPPPPMPKGQIVDVQEGNHQVPVESKYLAETNNKVERETVARDQVAAPGAKGSNYTTAGPVHRPPSRAPTPKALSARTPPPAASKERVASNQGPGSRPSLMDMLNRVSLPDAPAPTSDTPAPSDGEQTDGTAGEANGAIGSGASGAANDDLKDLPKGDGTYLNTREFLFAGFFNRMKQAVAAKWDPNGRLRQKDPQGRRFAGIDRTTVLMVTIDTDGALKDVYVAKSSGLDFLDAEAMEAVHRAAPFPNPPQGLFGGEPYFQFPYGFTVGPAEGLPLMFRSR